MAIQNGVERVEKIRAAMHREIDKLVDDVILGKPTRGFKITFDCGVDCLLAMSLTTDTVVTDDKGHFVYLEDTEDSDRVTKEGEEHGYCDTCKHNNGYPKYETCQGCLNYDKYERGDTE